MNVEPFLVFVDSPQGLRMLTFKFSVYAQDDVTKIAMLEKKLYLRNVVYNFLRTKNGDDLTSPNAVNTLKVSLRKAIVDELPGMHVGEVFIEQIHLH